MAIYLKTAAEAEAVDFFGMASLSRRTASGTEELWRKNLLGENWRALSCPDKPWKDLCWSQSKGLFVAVGTLGGVMTSPDGLIWTLGTTPERNSYQTICYGGGRFVAASYSGTSRIMRSSDGFAWTAHIVPASSWCDIAYGNDRYVAVSQTGAARIIVSSDAASWTEAPHFDRNWRGVAFCRGVFAVVSHTGDVATSGDGLHWTLQPGVNAGGSFSTLFTDGERFVALSESGSTRMMISEDGFSWSARSIPQLAWFKGAGQAGVMFCVAQGDTFITSHDGGGSWVSRTLPLNKRWQGAGCSSKRLVALTLEVGEQIVVSD